MTHTLAWIISGPDADPAEEQYPLSFERVREAVVEMAYPRSHHGDGRPFVEPNIKIHELNFVSGTLKDVTAEWFDHLFEDDREEAAEQRKSEELDTAAERRRDEMREDVL